MSHHPHLPGLILLRHPLGPITLWSARILGAFALAVFAYLLLDRGVPRSFRPEQWEVTSQLAALGFVAAGYLVAWWKDGAGAVLMLIGAVVLGSLASIEFTPGMSLLGALGFFIPGALFLLHWQQRTHPFSLFGVAAALSVLLLAGGIASPRIYNYYNGPTHPESTVELPRRDVVDWIWAGATGTDGFTVNAMLREEPEQPVLLVSPSSQFTNARRFAGELTAPGESNAVRFRATDLSPGTLYFYAVESGGKRDTGRAASINTLPAGPASFTIAVASCQRTGSNGSVYDRIREANPLVMLEIGDFHYENIDTNNPGAFRDAYTSNLTSPAQQALYLEVPVNYSWDDHDYGFNDADRNSASRPAATSVYRENVPHYDLPDASGSIYHAFTIGRVRFIVTDSRSARDPSSAFDDANKSMLGEAQKAWFKAELLAAREQYPVIVWVNGVPWITEATPGGDDWGGYATERRELADFIAKNGLAGHLVMLSGDAHMVALDDGTNSDFSTNGAPGWPVLHAAPLDRRANIKGGPYSEGAWGAGGQFGLMSVTDTGGDTITVRLSGHNWEGIELVSYAFTIDASQ